MNNNGEYDDYDGVLVDEEEIARRIIMDMSKVAERSAWLRRQRYEPAIEMIKTARILETCLKIKSAGMSTEEASTSSFSSSLTRARALP